MCATPLGLRAPVPGSGTRKATARSPRATGRTQCSQNKSKCLKKEASKWASGSLIFQINGIIVVPLVEAFLLWELNSPLPPPHHPKPAKLKVVRASKNSEWVIQHNSKRKYSDFHPLISGPMYSRYESDTPCIDLWFKSYTVSCKIFF